MSIHTETREETLKVSTVAKVKKFAEQTAKAYFERPVFYLFYISLPGLITALFFGIRFSVVLYLLVAGLGLANYFKRIKSILKKRLWRMKKNKSITTF